jgi:hypothetical protein
LPCKAKNGLWQRPCWQCCPALLWIYFGEKLQPVRYYKNRKSFRIIRHGRSSTDWTKTSDARSVLKQTVSLKSAIMQCGKWTNSRIIYPRLRLNSSLHDEIVDLCALCWYLVLI